MKRLSSLSSPVVLIGFSMHLSLGAGAQGGVLTTLDVAEGFARWQPVAEGEAVVLRVAAPDGRVREFSADGGEAIEVEFGAGGDWPDGTYVWEWIVVPPVDANLLDGLRKARLGGDEAEERRLMAQLPRPLRETGAFWVLGGIGVPNGLIEGEGAARPRSVAQPEWWSTLDQDQILGDDLIVSSSACFGFQCINGEAFGDPPVTLRLKDTVVRLEFPDTSIAPFPANDWQITINDDQSGGADRFSIEDLSGGKTPFTLRAGAPSDSLYVSSDGWLGLGTSTPGTEVHVRSADTPEIRLEQTGALARVWNMAANDARWSLSDGTAGTTPLRVAATAPTSSLEIGATGLLGSLFDLGLGTLDPMADLHILNATAPVLRLDKAAQSYDLSIDGSNYWVVKDVTSGFTPFRIAPGAPTEGVSVGVSGLAVLGNLGALGNVGAGTLAPEVALHVADATAPTLRLDRAGTSKWDLSVDGAGLFVTDVTGGSLTPLKVAAGAPTDSLFVGTNVAVGSSVGIGTATPSASLQVVRNNGGSGLATLLRLTNNGGIQFLLDRTDGQNDWQFSNFGSAFQISVPNVSASIFNIVDIGDIQVTRYSWAVDHKNTSSRALKEGFTPIDVRDVLARVVTLPITQWSYIADPDHERYIGPMAEDFAAAFPLGERAGYLSVSTANGVALAAIQGLHAELKERDTKIADLERQVAELRKLVLGAAAEGL